MVHNAIILPNVNGGSGSDLRYGPHAFSKFDYYQNSERVGVDALHPNGQNPLLIMRHPGGGTVGSHRWWRDSSNDDTTLEGLFDWIQWLLGAQPSTKPALKWDVATVTTGQQTHTGGGFPRTRSMFFPESIVDYQNMIASIMHLSWELGFDEQRVISGGSSMGALLGGLAMMAPGLRGTGSQHVWVKGRYVFDTHRSTPKGHFHHQGPIDFQTYGGIPYYHHTRVSGLAGTRFDTAAEWTALDPRYKAMFSIVEYFRRRETAGYRGFLISWAEQGSHVHPFGSGVPGDGSLHDSIQATELATAISECGLPYHLNLHQVGWMINTQWPAGPNPLALSIYQEYENWMALRVA